MDVVDLPLEQIIPYARNPRNNADAVATVAASIQEFGWRQPIVVDEAMVVLAGHTRLEAARKLGFKTAPVHVAKGLTASQARAFRIMDNRSSENAEWDKDLLNLELADLLEADFDLGLTGFTDDELNALMSSLEEGAGPQEGEDDVPEPPEDPTSRPGDLWILGNHRLLCGDSTVATDFERVLNGVKPLLLVSDPPYGVEYDPSWRNQAGAAKTKRTGKVLNDDRADWREAWALFPGDVAYVWHGALHAATVAESLEVAGFTIRSQIIWAKERLVLSRGDYHWQHEPCQPAGTLVQKVIERGAGSQPALIGEVPIETLQVGDLVVSYNPYESVVRRLGRQITRFGERQFDGFMHAISAAGRVTRATPEHRFSVRLNPDASDKQVVYPMARNGRAGQALFMTAIAPFVGIMFGVVLLAGFSVPLSRVALKFGPQEYVALMSLGLIAAAVIGTGRPIRSLALGLALGLIGLDLNSGIARFTFGQTVFFDRLPLFAVAIGLFGLPEIIANAGRRDVPKVQEGKIRLRNMLPTPEDWRRSAMPMARGAGIGGFFVALPGTGGLVATFVSYAVERKVSKHPEEFGKGAIKGVAAPEAANNASVQSAFIPTLSLGIPGDPVMAIMLGVMMIHGILPGPGVIQDRPDLFWGLVVSFVIGNISLLILNLPLIGMWILLLKIPYNLLFPVIVSFTCIGIYSANYQIMDIFVLLAFGFLGVGMKALNSEVAPLLLGFVPGPMIEIYFRRSQAVSGGDLGTFFDRPISATIMVITLAILLWAFGSSAWKGYKLSRA